MKNSIENVPLKLERQRSRSGQNRINNGIISFAKTHRFRKFYFAFIFLLSTSLLVVSLYHVSEIKPESFRSIGESIIANLRDDRIVAVRSEVLPFSKIDLNSTVLPQKRSDEKTTTEIAATLLEKQPMKVTAEVGIAFPHKPAKEEELACHIPSFNAFHESVMKFVKVPEKIECETADFPLLFKVDVDSTLVKVKHYQDYGFDACCYRQIKRMRNNDDEVVLANDCTPIEEERTKIDPELEHIAISCRNKSEEWVDIDAFSIPQLKPVLETWIDKNQIVAESNQEQLNVVILGLDGVSNLNYQRTMKLTNSYMRKHLSAFSFDGYVKIGDNTLPNAAATLTGKTLIELNQTCWMSKDDYFDRCNFIWKNYSDHGYRTVLGEDAAQIATFNYLKSGFKNVPVDYYLRPTLLFQDLYIGHHEFVNAFACYGPRLAFEVTNNYMKNLAFSMNKTHKYFQYLWVNSLFHDDSNVPFLFDNLLLETLTWFYDGGYLNNTVLILMSDHGMRWGEIRDTFQGKFEDRMPLLQIVFPPWFRQKYSQALVNLEYNQKMLTTHFDLHETLMDLLFLYTKVTNGKIKEREKLLNNAVSKKTVPRGISLFLPIPKSRDCKSAGIDESWCVCHSMKPLSVKNNSLVEEAVNFIVQDINLKLKGSTMCAQLKIDTVMHAHLLLNDGNIGSDSQTESSRDDFETETENAEPVQTLELAFRTKPGRAAFESTVVKLADGTWAVQGGISRTNLYKKQSACIKNSVLKQFCFCTN